MGARITYRDVANLEGQVDLGFGEIFIGRSMECAIRTDDPLVSRRHARIYFTNGSHVIEDLGSANGIYLGEVRVPSHPMQNGDSIRCGNLWIRYMNEPAVAQYPQPSQGPQMSAGGGTQLLNVNENFIPGRGSDLPSPPMPPMPPMPGGGGMPPNPFAPQGMMPQVPMPMPPPPVPMPPMSGFGSPPMIGGTTGGGMGGPPPPMPGPSMPMGGPPPPAPISISGSIGGGPPPPAPGGPVINRSSPVGPSAVVDAAEVQRMQRRIDQLTSELRMQRGGGDRAMRMEELEERASRLEKDNEALEGKTHELENLMAQTGSDYNPNRANLQLSRAEEVCTALSDVLSEIRINLLAADGEVEQYANVLPAASYELVREAIRSSRAQMETARDIMRMLRDTR